MEEFDFDIRQNNNDENSSLNYPLIIGLIVALLLIGGGIYWFLTRDNDDADAVQKEVVSDNDDTTATDAVNQAAEKVIDSTDFNQNTEETTDLPVDQTTEITDDAANTTSSEAATSTTSDESSSYDNSSNIYFIVSGAFKNKENANNKVTKLIADGFNAVVAGQNGAGLFIVAYEGFPNIDEAKTKLAEIRQSHPQAWIYKKQN